MTTGDALLRVQGLRTGFGPTTVLHGVDLDVHRGETVVMLGLNGAGKSVCLKVVGGLLPAWTGTVELDGVDVTASSVEERVALGFAHVPQGRQLFVELSVEENLRLGAYLLRRRAPERYDAVLGELLDRFPRLAERRTQTAGSLSGGEQAMLAVARALMSEPKLLLIDEPTAGLAPAVVDEVRALLAEVAASGVTILLVEQHVRFALALADRFVVLQRGRIVHTGPVATIDHDELARLLGIGRLVTTGRDR